MTTWEKTKRALGQAEQAAFVGLNKIGDKAKVAASKALATETGQKAQAAAQKAFGVGKKYTLVLVVDPVTKFGKYVRKNKTQPANQEVEAEAGIEESKGSEPDPVSNEAPSDAVLICPITKETIREPAMTIHGQLYEH